MSPWEGGIVIKLRVEDKYIVSQGELIVLEKRLSAIMRTDVHQHGDGYMIRSLYFDGYQDPCMDENESGVDNRKKYRIRIYDPSDAYIRLEIKEKIRGLTQKTSCMLTRGETEAMMRGQIPPGYDERAPLNAMKMRMRLDRFAPRAVISYERAAFVCPTGNVRITFDRNITASRVCEDFLSEYMPCEVPVLPAGMHVLEVKYDELLPDYIAQALDTGRMQQTAFSKYYLGRMALLGDRLPVGLL